MKLFIILKFTVVFLSLGLLFSCSSGSGSGNNSSSITPAALTLTPAGIKNFRFTWTDVSEATFYKLLENPDSVSGFTQLGNDIAQGVQSVDHVVPLYARINAQYILQSCNSTGCTDSESISVGNLLASIGYIKASNADVAGKVNFGNALSLSADGTTLAVGATGESSNATGIDGNQTDRSAINAGAVYVFGLIGSTWSQQAYIKASNAEAGDRFGRSVSLSNDGNTLAVGANLESSNTMLIGGNQGDNTAANAGAVYVFSRVSSAWSQQAYVKASNAEADDRFGDAISLSGDGNTLVVSARLEDSSATSIEGNQTDNSALNSGAVYVFSRSGSTWFQQAYIKASNAESDDQFGQSVSLSENGSTLTVGAIGEDSHAIGIGGNQDNNTAGNSGAVYVFSRSSSTWSQQAYIKSSNSELSDFFGIDVSLSGNGNTLAVGAINEDSNATGIGGNQADNSMSSAGAAYIFSRSGSTWSQQAYVKASNTELDDSFGLHVSLSKGGDTLAVSGTGESSGSTSIGGNQADNMDSNSGAVYIFSRSSGSWMQQAYVKASNTGANDQFGLSLGLSMNGSTLAVGASFEDSNAPGIGGDQNNDLSISAGAVYLY